MQHHSTTSSKSLGFTLVELAIVLVIIGLLVGGVLVGQTLIQTAALNGTAAQLESYNSAATTFLGRNGGIPGDLSAARAASFGLTARAGSTGRGDGNRLIQNGPVVANQQGLGYETALFWRDLWDSDFIQTPMLSASDAPAANITSVALSSWMPPSKTRNSAYFHIYTFSGRTFFRLGGFAASATDANGVLSLADGLSPGDAFYLDEKLDDGMGGTGSVLAISSIITHAIDTGTGVAGDCLNASNGYNTDNNDASVIACSITVRTSF